MTNFWNKIYKTNQQHSVYPWSNLVSIVSRNFKKSFWKQVPILEIGCGFGANISFLLDCGFDYYGIDISPYAINKLKKKFPKLKNKLFALDFSKEEILNDIQFNIIIDRGSGTHCSTEQFKNFLKLYKNNFNKGIYYVGLDWFSKKHSESRNGKKIDNFTRTNFRKGQFKDCGSVHFSTEAHIKKVLFKEWNCIYFIENNSLYKSENNYRIASFDFVMKKN